MTILTAIRCLLLAMEIHQRSADVMEGKSPINMDLGLTPAGVINLWLDEYFLRLKWQSYERSARDATADELVAGQRFDFDGASCSQSSSVVFL